MDIVQVLSEPFVVVGGLTGEHGVFIQCRNGTYTFVKVPILIKRLAMALIMRYRLWLAVLVSTHSLLAQSTGAKPSGPAAPEIYLIGSVHNLHFEERYHYSLVDLQAQVRSLHPDVVCGEITQDAFNGPMEGNFPPEAAMLAETAAAWGARFIPADWRISFAWQARAQEQEDGNQAQAARVNAEQNRIKAYYGAFPGGSLYDYLNGSAQFQAMSDHMFEDVIGENTPSDIAAGAWHERNRRIVENCLSGAGPAKRIVFVFGAGHVAQLRRQLVARGLTGQVPRRMFVPAGLGTMPPAVISRWRRNLKNLNGIADGTLIVSGDMKAKVRDTHRAPQLSSEIALYSSVRKTR